MDLMNKCGWAQNRAKLARAIKEVEEKTGKEATEEAVKVVYIRLLGVVLPEKEAKKEEEAPKEKKSKK